MLTTIEGVYKDGKVELSEQPAGMTEARVLVTFLPQDTPALPAKTFKKLHGAWRGKFPEDFDVEAALKEIRSGQSHGAVDADQLILFARSLKGKTLYTRSRGCPFAVAVSADGLLYTPVNTGLSRPHHRKDLDRVLARFNETKSVRPRDYQDLTHNASYTLALLDLYLQHSDPS